MTKSVRLAFLFLCLMFVTDVFSKSGDCNSIPQFIPPVSDFTAPETCANEMTTLMDLTTNTPTTWLWSFAPTTPAFQNGTTANSQNPQVIFANPGKYDITLTTSNLDGMNTITKAIYIYGTTSMPIDENFSAGVFDPEWLVINPDNSEGWEIITVTGIDGNPSVVARMDNYSYDAVGQLDELVLPNVDISGFINPRLYFDVAYAPYGGSNFEHLHVEYSVDCGANFAMTSYNKSGATLATVPNQTNGWGPSLASHWRTDSVDLSTYGASPSIILKLIQTNGYGNGLFIDNIRVEERIDLPVELTRFEGDSKDCNIHLNWTSASEENFDYYEIQKSDNGKDFSMITTIESKGGILSQDYQYIDKETNGSSYYRLKMMDIDGTYEYSEIIFIEKSCRESERGIKLFPNPIEQRKLLQIEFYSTAQEEEIVCLNAQGVVVKRIMFSSEKGWNKKVLDISNLTKGAYYIHIGNQVEKLVII